MKEAIDQERQTNGRHDHPTPSFPLLPLFNGLSKTGTTAGRSALRATYKRGMYERWARDIRSTFVAIHKTTLNAALKPLNTP